MLLGFVALVSAVLELKDRDGKVPRSCRSSSSTEDFYGIDGHGSGTVRHAWDLPVKPRDRPG